jgi:hypothetical protein
MLLDHVGKIKERESDSNPAVAQAAKIAVKTILWKP